MSVLAGEAHLRFADTPIRRILDPEQRRKGHEAWKAEQDIARRLHTGQRSGKTARTESGFQVKLAQSLAQARAQARMLELERRLFPDLHPDSHEVRRP